MATDVKSWKLFIGGEWVDTAGGDTEPDINPATEEKVAEVTVGTKQDVDRAVQAAQRAYDDVWFDTPPKERADRMLRLADAIEADAATLAHLESIDVGKPITAAKTDIPFIVDNFRFFAGAARLQEGKSSGEYERGFTSIIRREPLGVTAGICPWNYPLMMAIWKIGPALAAGNTSILKPAQITPLSTLRLAELSQDILPPGVLNVVTGRGAVVGDALARHPVIRLVSVTGDTATGKLIQAAAAENVKRVHLELGGKAPVVVFDDAPLERLIQTLKFAGYTNSGQDCTASCRIVAGPGIYEDLVRELIPVVESINVGDIGDDKVEMGPLVSAKQRENVKGFVERAQKKGGEGHRRRRGGRRQGLLLQADRGHRRRPEVGDRPAGGLRPRRHGAAVQRRGPGRGVGERCRIRLGLLCVDEGRRPRDADGTPASVRNRVGEYAFHDHGRDAARRVQGERLRQGHVDVLPGGLHADQARGVGSRVGAGRAHSGAD